MELEDLALKTLKYFDINKPSDHKYPGKVPYLLSNEYKRQCLSAMGVKDLVDIILINPTVFLSESQYNTPMKLEQLQMRPMLNLTFTRDQQLVTNKGIVITNMGAQQRDMETTIIKFCLEKLGLPILGKIHPPGTIEGGDFVSVSEDLCMIGSGLRTNFFAIKQMLENNWFGTRRVAVVRDIFDCNQQRMHLDTIFNIASDNCVVMLESVMGDNSDRRRLVTEYTYNTDTGNYGVSRRDVELSLYIREQGYHIIPISEQQQEAYGINFLNIGDNRIIAVDESTARTILSDKNFNGNIEVIDFSGVTTMYGSVHCCSQVLYREPKTIKKITREISHFESKDHLLSPSPRCQNNKNELPSSVLLIAPSYNLVENIQNEEVDPENIMVSRASMYRKDEGYDMEILQEIRKEFSVLHRELVKRDIKPIVVTQYVHEEAPFSSFPNHILSTHSSNETIDGKNIFIWHSIKNPSRRQERKQRIRNLLGEFYDKEVNLYELYEEKNKFLEGTASLVLDRNNLNAFVLVHSSSTNPSTNLEVAKDILNDFLKYNLQVLEPSTSCPKDLLTQRVLFIADTFAFVCIEALSESSQNKIREILSDKQIIEFSIDQCRELATSMALLSGKQLSATKRYLIISQSSLDLFNPIQINALRAHVDEIVPVDIKVTEEHAKLGLDSMICPFFLA